MPGSSHLDKFQSQIWKNLFEGFSFLFKLKSQSVSEDKFFSTGGRGEGGERSDHRVVFLSKDIVGSISCWCEDPARFTETNTGGTE